MEDRLCQRVKKIIGGNSDCLALGGQWRLVTTLGTQCGRERTDGWTDERAKAESQET